PDRNQEWPGKSNPANHPEWQTGLPDWFPGAERGKENLSQSRRLLFSGHRDNSDNRHDPHHDQAGFGGGQTGASPSRGAKRDQNRERFHPDRSYPSNYLQWTHRLSSGAPETGNSREIDLLESGRE